MNAEQTARATIRSAVAECDSHLARSRRAWGLLDAFFPLTTDELKSASEEQIEHIDQFVYRFTKLQDSMGARLLPSLYAWNEEHYEPKPFRDVLNRLEQLEILPSVRQWQFFRDLRNVLAHDYPETVDDTVMTLNTLHSHWQKMEHLYEQVREYCQEKGLVDTGE